MFIGSCVILQPLRQGLRGSPFTDEDTDFREVKVLARGHTAWDVKLGLSVCLSAKPTGPSAPCHCWAQLAASECTHLPGGPVPGQREAAC